MLVLSEIIQSNTNTRFCKFKVKIEFTLCWLVSDDNNCIQVLQYSTVTTS